VCTSFVHKLENNFRNIFLTICFAWKEVFKGCLQTLLLHSEICSFDTCIGTILDIRVVSSIYATILGVEVVIEKVFHISCFELAGNVSKYFSSSLLGSLISYSKMNYMREAREVTELAIIIGICGKLVSSKRTF
jgi:hypothetical protein